MKSIFKISFAKIAEAAAHYGTAKITSSAMACQKVIELLGDYYDSCLDSEELHVITLDTKNGITGIFQCTRGTLDASLVHPREVFKIAIANSASSIILVHNHPSGDPVPSREDFAVTRRLEEVGEIVGINVLDHIVYADRKAISIAESR